MAKNLFYKFDNRKDRNNPIVEHNIPEDKIISYDELRFKRISHGSYYTRTYLSVDIETFNNVFKGKLIFPTEYTFGHSKEYLGAVLIRAERGDVLTFCGSDGDTVTLYPTQIYKERDKEWGYGYATYDKLPARNVKVFLSNEDYDAYSKEQLEKKNNRLKKYISKYDELQKSIPVFSFKSPTFVIDEIIKETDWVDIKVGDTIRGELPVIEIKNGEPYQCLKGIGTRTNYIDIYVNDKKVRSVSPLTFQDLFFNNFKVQKVITE